MVVFHNKLSAMDNKGIKNLNLFLIMLYSNKGRRIIVMLIRRVSLPRSN